MQESGYNGFRFVLGTLKQMSLLFKAYFLQATFTTRCICARGFVGDYCEDTIDVCMDGTCLNNATCDDTSTGYKCLCDEGEIVFIISVMCCILTVTMNYGHVTSYTASIEPHGNLMARKKV